VDVLVGVASLGRPLGRSVVTCGMRSEAQSVAIEVVALRCFSFTTNMWKSQVRRNDLQLAQKCNLRRLVRVVRDHNG